MGVRVQRCEGSGEWEGKVKLKDSAEGIETVVIEREGSAGTNRTNQHLKTDSNKAT